jgi:hypothetical protein
MSIEKESSGLPEIDPRRVTTKVNLGMVFAIGVFFAIVLGVVLYLSHRERTGMVQGPSVPMESSAQKSP